MRAEHLVVAIYAVLLIWLWLRYSDIDQEGDQ